MGMLGRTCGGRAARLRVKVVGWVLTASLVLAPARAMATSESYVDEFGLGVGSIVVNLLYMPVKFVYGTLGAVTGGLAFVLTGGRLDTAKAVWKPSMGGTYVVTPSMLRGDDPIYFSGSADSAEARPEPAEEEKPPASRPSPGEGY